MADCGIAAALDSFAFFRVLGVGVFVIGSPCRILSFWAEFRMVLP